MPEKLPACTACDLCDLGARTVCLPPEGPEDADILFLGDAPGAQEDARGRPFQGPEGKLLRETVAEHMNGFSYRFSNTVRCRPPEDRTPLTKEKKACKAEHLIPELKRVQPKLIVAVGATALSALTGSRAALQKEGLTQPSEWGPVYPIAHPSYVKKHPAHRQKWEEAIRRIELVLRPRPLNLDYRLLRTRVDIESYLRRLREKKPLCAIDYETTGLNPWTFQVISVAVTHEEGQGYCFDPALAEDAWKAFLASDVPKTTHNGGFEEVVSRVHYRTPMAMWIWDSKQGQRTLDENARNGLKAQALEHTDLGDYSIHERAEMEGDNWAEKTVEDVWEYNCFDTDATWRRSEQQMEECSEEQRKQVLKSIFHTRALVSARIEGFHVDVDRLESVESSLHQEVEAAFKELRQSVLFQRFEEEQGEPFNVKSPPQTAKLVYEVLGCKTTARKSKAGNMPTKKAVLEGMRDQSPLLDPILRARSAMSVLQTYLKQVKETVVDGKIHPSFNVGAAKTWRISASKPPLQSFPHNEEFLKLFKPRPGWVLLEVDYSQIELRVLAAFSREPSLVQTFKDGKDPHQRTASKVFHVDLDAVEPWQRARGKAINFGTIYGITEVGMDEKFNIPEEEALAMLEAYWETHPLVKAWVEEQYRLGRERGYVESAFGRRRHLPDLLSSRAWEVSRAENQASNFPVQSTAGEITLDAGVDTVALLGERYYIGNKHDSAILQAPEDEYMDVYRDVKKVMEGQADWFMGDVPLVVDGKVGPSWGEMEDIDE